MRRRPARSATLGVLMLLSVSCMPSLEPSALPTSSPSPPAASETSPASTSPTPDLATLPQLGEVAVDRVAIYAAPGGSSKPLGELPLGTPVLLIEAAADPDWVRILALDGDLTDEMSLAFGWARERSGADVQISRVVVSRSTSGTLLVAEFRALGPAGGLVSYRGGAAPDVVGFLVEGCGTGLSRRFGEPLWLNGTFTSVPVAAVTVPPGGPVPDDAIVFLRASPGVAASTCAGVAAGWYRFSGHFDDPASATCRTTTSLDGSTQVDVDPELANVLCRLRFAITGLTPIPSP